MDALVSMENDEPVRRRVINAINLSVLIWAASYGYQMPCYWIISRNRDPEPFWERLIFSGLKVYYGLFSTYSSFSEPPGAVCVQGMGGMCNLLARLRKRLLSCSRALSNAQTTLVNCSVAAVAALNVEP
jgi:hypothetical protein